MKIEYSAYREKVLGCWLGKAIGGTLGGPWEGVPMPHELTYYDPVPDKMLPNDDLDLQVVWLQLLLERGLPVDRRELADAWKRHIHLWPGEYGVCRVNLDYGLYPPLTGAFDNPTHDGMGAAIRTELWACLAPGDPQLAARLALEDACCDHKEEGIHAATFFVTIQSLAFISSDRDWLLQQGLTALPSDSRVRHAVKLVMDAWPRMQNRKAVLNLLLEHHFSDDFTYTPMNLGITVLGWLAGNSKFGDSILAAVNCGQDTDCTGASLGAILGLIDPTTIEQHWLEPIGMDLVLSPGMTGMAPLENLEQFTDQVADLASQVLAYYGSEVNLVGVPPRQFNLKHRVPATIWNSSVTLHNANPKDSRLATYPLALTATYPEAVRMAPGKQYEIGLALRNLNDDALDLQVEIDAPQGWTLLAPRASTSVKITPETSQTINLHIQPEETIWRPYTSPCVVRLQRGGLAAEHRFGLLSTIPFAVWKAASWPTTTCPERPDTATLFEAPAHEIPLQELGNADDILILQTHVKIPFHSTPRFVTQTSVERRTSMWLDDEHILEQPGGFYCPAVHLADHTGVDKTMRRGGYRLTIAIDKAVDKDVDRAEQAGTLFFAIGYGDLWKWMEDVEYQNPLAFAL